MRATLKNSLGQVYIDCHYDPAKNWVIAEWYGFVTIEEVKAGALEVLRLLETHHAAFLLNSNEKLEGPWSEANEWIAEVWMPRALAAGLKRFAHIVSPDIFAVLSAEDMQTKLAQLNFELLTFEERSEAEAWLTDELVHV